LKKALDKDGGGDGSREGIRGSRIGIVFGGGVLAGMEEGEGEGKSP